MTLWETLAGTKMKPKLNVWWDIWIVFATYDCSLRYDTEKSMKWQKNYMTRVWVLNLPGIHFIIKNITNLNAMSNKIIDWKPLKASYNMIYEYLFISKKSQISMVKCTLFVECGRTFFVERFLVRFFLSNKFFCRIIVCRKLFVGQSF